MAESTRAYEQWEVSLEILLRHGATINDVFHETRFVEVLPQIGTKKDGGIEDLALVRENECSFKLHRHLNIYAILLEHDLDTNIHIK